MKAIVQNEYGSPDAFELAEIDKPAVKETEVLVRVHAAALHGLRDAGKIQPGQKVLINGASGGVGTFAVQIAKAFGAEVTGVCSTRNVDMVRSLGADHVIDYTQEAFTQSGQRYDLILDQVANHSLSDCRRALTHQGTHIPNSGHSGVGFAVKALVVSLFVRRQGRPYLSIPKTVEHSNQTQRAATKKKS